MNKIINDQQISSINVENIVLVGGSFDILHPGHIKFLTKAKHLGSTLMVLLESDERIRQLKGENRPVNNLRTRAKNLANLDIVDYVILLSPKTSNNYYYELVKQVKPAIIAVTKGDPLLDIKKDQAQMVKGKVVEVMERNTRYSTTGILRKENNA